MNRTRPRSLWGMSEGVNASCELWCFCFLFIQLCLFELLSNTIEYNIFAPPLYPSTTTRIDDIINTGGTMRNAIETVGRSGASEVYAWATHGVLHLPNNDAPQKIQDMDCLKYLLVSNSVAVDRELPKKIRKLSIAPLLAESVARSLHSESISTIFSTEAPGLKK